MSDDKVRSENKDRHDDKVKQKLREYLRSGRLNGLAKHIVADLSDEEAQQIQEKFNKLFRSKNDVSSEDADSAEAKIPDESQTGDAD